jgi:hypothetical protein
MSALVSVSQSAVDGWLWLTAWLVLGVYVAARIARCLIDRADGAVSRWVYGHRERDEDAAYEQGYRDGQESGGVEDVAKAAREPTGRHSAESAAEVTGALSVVAGEIQDPVGVAFGQDGGAP